MYCQFMLLPSQVRYRTVYTQWT